MAISRKAGFFSAKFERSLKRLIGKYKQEQQVPRERKNESVDSFNNKEEAGSGLRM